MAHPPPHLHEGTNHQFHFAAVEAAFAQLSIPLPRFHNPPHRVHRLGIGGVGGEGSKRRFTAVGQHQDRRFFGAGYRAPVTEAALLNGSAALLGLVQEVAHFQGALVLRDEIGDGPGQAVAPRQLQPLIHMGLKHRRTRLGVIQRVVGIGAVLLVLDEPVRGMQFAHVVVQRTGPDQIHIRTNRPRPFLRQAADHQGVFKGSRGFAGEAAQQGALLIRQFQQPRPGEQAKGALEHRDQQQAEHQQNTEHKGIGGQFIQAWIQISPEPQAGDRLQLQQQPLPHKGANRQQHRELQQLAAAALTACDQGPSGGHRCRHNQATVPQPLDGFWPEQSGHPHPDQAAAGAEAFRQHQGGRHQHGQRAHGAFEPELGSLHQQQQAHRQQRVAHLQARPFTPHHQQHHGAGCSGFNEPLEPDQRLGFAAHAAEIIQHVVGLGTDQLALAGDQIPLAHLDGGDGLFGQLFLDQLFAQVRIGAQVAAAAEDAGEHLAGQGACRFWLQDNRLQLLVGGLAQLLNGQVAHQPLAEHAISGAAHRFIPGQMLPFAASFQPPFLLIRQVHRPDPVSRSGVGDLLQLQQLLLEPLFECLGLLLIDHLHHRSRHQRGPLLLEGGAVLHQGILWSDGFKRGH